MNLIQLAANCVPCQHAATPSQLVLGTLLACIIIIGGNTAGLHDKTCGCTAIACSRQPRHQAMSSKGQQPCRNNQVR